MAQMSRNGREGSPKRRWVVFLALVGCVGPAILGLTQARTLFETLTRGPDRELARLSLQIQEVRGAVARRVAEDALTKSGSPDGDWLVEVLPIGQETVEDALTLQARFNEEFVEALKRGHLEQVWSKRKGRLVVMAGERPVGAPSLGDSMERLWLDQDDVPTCVVQLPRGFDELIYRQNQASQAVSSCLLIAKFGAPGDHVGNWFASAGSDLAGRVYRDTLDAPDLDWGLRDHPLGKKSTWRIHLGLIECAAGDLETCEALVVDQGGTVHWSGDLYGVRGQSIQVRGPMARMGRWGLNSLLFELIREEGPERFEAFWTSPASLTVAFEEAYDRPMGEWVKEKVSNEVHVPQRSPRPEGTTWLAGLLFAGVFFGGSLVRARNIFVA